MENSGILKGSMLVEALPGCTKYLQRCSDSIFAKISWIDLYNVYIKFNALKHQLFLEPDTVNCLSYDDVPDEALEATWRLLGRSDIGIRLYSRSITIQQKPMIMV